jgi:hypothetical protein
MAIIYVYLFTDYLVMELRFCHAMYIPRFDDKIEDLGKVSYPAE